MSKVRNISIWVSLGLASAAFAAAGIAKLMGVEQVHMSFGMLGLPVWFGYFIGACELLGAIGLWVRKTTVPAAIGLIIIMLGAAYFHIFVEGVPANGFPAIVLLVLLINIFLGRKGNS